MIVTYQSRPFVRRCLRSLDAASIGTTYEVIVADNDPDDGSAAEVRAEFPDAAIIATGKNVGFAKAVNRAIARATGRYILLLNPDTESLPGSVTQLMRFLDATPRAAVAAPRLLNPDHSDQGTARSFPGPANALFGRRSALTRTFPANRWSRAYLIGRNRLDDYPFEVDWVSGACLMARREAVDRVGVLDEGFFMYWEDADWCRRFKDAGFGVFCVPAARVVHDEGRSSVGRGAQLVWIFHRSVYRYYAKHHARGIWTALRGFAAAALAMRAVSIILADRIAASGVFGSRARVSNRR